MFWLYAGNNSLNTNNRLFENIETENPRVTQF